MSKKYVVTQLTPHVMKRRVSDGEDPQRVSIEQWEKGVQRLNTGLSVHIPWLYRNPVCEVNDNCNDCPYHGEICDTIDHICRTETINIDDYTHAVRLMRAKLNETEKEKD